MNIISKIFSTRFDDFFMSINSVERFFWTFFMIFGTLPLTGAYRTSPHIGILGHYFRIYEKFQISTELIDMKKSSNRFENRFKIMFITYTFKENQVWDDSY